MKEMGFIGACGDFFGKKSGQTLINFRDEIKQLSTKDREEIKKGLEQNGYKIVEAGVNHP